MGASRSAVTFRTRPFTDRCDRIRQRGDHALIGVSTNNSYFSAERLTALVHWAQGHFRAVDIICADLHIDTVLTAEGAAPENVGRRARRRVTDVRRRIRKAVDAASPDGPRPGSHLLSDFQGNPAYQSLRSDIDRALREDPEFANACHDMIRLHLLGRPQGADDIDFGTSGNGPGDAAEHRRFQAGLQYLGGELPFFVDTPSILGVPSSVSCYHLFTPILGPLCMRDNGLRAADNQAFLAVTPDEAPHRPPHSGPPKGTGNSAPGRTLRSVKNRLVREDGHVPQPDMCRNISSENGV
ncbi:tRNA-dependent cyclodipeptide synthase [Streptomyces rimosus]|uniref:tRNA-dependent cyclodipeptide synthase n=1 Tax=Streptomyces rimosus TaxID=1927 RepID=UPI00067C50E1|nr:tRNA-dependent cyclodipeptide synthase [Streptomyces rimosus]